MHNFVLILAGDTDGNLGDRAIVFATCEDLRRINPQVDITLLSSNPAQDSEYFGARAIARGVPGFLDLLKAAWRSDMVLCGGGGLFQDDTSLIKMPYWAVRLLMVRMLARRIVGYALGVGPLSWRSSQLAARFAFACMDEISVRDSLAQSTTSSLTSKPVRVVPDPALLLSSVADSEARALLEQHGVPLDGRSLVAVAVRKWFHHDGATIIPHKYAAKYRLRKIPGAAESVRMEDLLARALDRVIEACGAYVVFMPTYNVSHEGDNVVSRNIMQKMHSDSVQIVEINEPRLYKTVAAQVDVMLGGRMHPTILSASHGVPVIGLSYNQKFDGFFKLLGREDKLMHIEDFVREDKVEELVDLVVDAVKKEPGSESNTDDLIRQTREFNAHIMG